MVLFCIRFSVLGEWLCRWFICWLLWFVSLFRVVIRVGVSVLVLVLVFSGMMVMVCVRYFFWILLLMWNWLCMVFRKIWFRLMGLCFSSVLKVLCCSRVSVELCIVVMFCEWGCCRIMVILLMFWLGWIWL